MFKVGDVVKVVGGRRGDRYRVIAIHPMYPHAEMILRNIHYSDPCMNFTSSDNGHLELDKIYLRRKKLDKILDDLDSLMILEEAESMMLARNERERLMLLEVRKQKIQKICTNMVTK